MGELTTAGRRLRRVTLGIAAFTALSAVLGGIARLGLGVPVGDHHAGDHGPLFVLGAFGTIIALERAVALGVRAGWLAPIAGVATAILLLGRQHAAAPWAATLAGAALVAVNVAVFRRQRAAFTALMGLGSIALAGGSLFWALGRPVFQVVPAWMGFFVLTIVGERLELSRLAPVPPWARPALVALSVALVVALVLAVVSAGGLRAASLRTSGALLAAIALWELSFDLARRTIRQPGLPRFAATGVLAGVVWLLAGGLLLARGGLPAGGLGYDAVLHAVHVGFVLSMVMAHVPIILPAVARIEVPFHRVLYAPLAVLHAGLAVRLAGDLLGDGALRGAGGVANSLALVLVPPAILTARRLARRSPHP